MISLDFMGMVDFLTIWSINCSSLSLSSSFVLSFERSTFRQLLYLLFLRRLYKTPLLILNSELIKWNFCSSFVHLPANEISFNTHQASNFCSYSADSFWYCTLIPLRLSYSDDDSCCKYLQRGHYFEVNLSSSLDHFIIH